MRHAARLPPPPVFNDRRLLLLIAFCKSQSIDHSFGVCVFCLRLNLACFGRYLYVLDVCCQFASCRATLAICKSYCKIVPEIHQTNANNHQILLNIHPISATMAPRSAPKSNLEASWFWDRQKVPTPGARHTLFGTTWVILVAIWCPAGRQGASKIYLLSTKSRKHFKKCRPE